MDNTDLKLLIDDYTEIEYRYGKLNGQLCAIVAACEYELRIRGREKWTSKMENVSISAAMILHMLGQQIPQDIKDIYAEKDPEPINVFDPEDYE